MAITQQDYPSTPGRYEVAFIRAVLEFHGVQGTPTGDQAARARRVLRTYLQQVEDNPKAVDPGLCPARLTEEEQAALDARAFLQFGATKPTPIQWEAVHRSLYGPAACNVGEH